MAKAIEQGLPKRRIEEAAARTQARIDAGRQTVIGVNAFPPTVERELNVLKVDAASVRAMQIEKLKRLRAERDEAKTQAALAALTAGARGEGQPAAALRRSRARESDASAKSRSRWKRPSAVMSRRSAPSPASISPESGPAAEANERVMAMTARLRRERGAASAHPGRQDGPGRPRPRPEDHRLGLRRPRLRRQDRAAVRHARGSGDARGGEQRSYRRRLIARRGPSRAGARAEERARQGRDWARR